MGPGEARLYELIWQRTVASQMNDAVGETTSITGTLVLDDRGAVVRQESRFEVDLSTLKSDSDRRDNYIRRRTLQTDTYPKAVFVPTALRGAPSTCCATARSPSLPRTIRTSRNRSTPAC